MRLEGWHLIIIIVLALVLFAAPKLPGMARSLGQSMRIFKSEVREMKKDGATDTNDDSDPCPNLIRSNVCANKSGSGVATMIRSGGGHPFSTGHAHSNSICRKSSS